MIVAGIPIPIAIRSDSENPEEAPGGESAGDDEVGSEVDEEGEEGEEEYEDEEDEEDKRNDSCDCEDVESLIIARTY
jgi:hypothetical protein